MDIRFVLPSEVEQLARNVVTHSLPRRRPPCSRTWKANCTVRTRAVTSAVLTTMEPCWLHPDDGFHPQRQRCDDAYGGRSLCLRKLSPQERAGGLHAPEGVDAVLRQTGDADRLSPPLQSRVLCQHGIRLLQRELSLPAKPSAIRSYGDKSGLSYARPEDRQEILDFYRAYAARTHGATVHHYMDPHRIFDMPYVVVCRRDGRLTGYFTFDFVAVDHYTDMYHDLLVPEMVYEDLDTLRQS